MTAAPPRSRTSARTSARTRIETDPATGLSVTIRPGAGAPPVFWLHAYTMDSSLWAPVWDLLPEHTHIGVDLPGHGHSPALPADPTLPGIAAQVAEVARTHGATRVVALCFGTCVALQWAIDQPASITALAVSAPTLAGTIDEPAAQRRYRELTMLRRFVGPGEQLTGLWMSSPPNIFLGLQDRPGPAAAVREVLMRHSWNELLDGSMGRLTRGAVHTPEQLAGITARTQVLVGSEDLAAMLTNAQILRDTVPDVQVQHLPGQGHLPPIEDPSAFAPLVADLLR